MKILISGFQTFGTHSLNPTTLLVEAIQQKKIQHPSNIELEGIILPVTFDTSFEELQLKINQTKPDIILSFGLAGRRDAIEFERVAINCMDAYIPDNDGEQPRDEKIDPKGETAYFSSLPIRELEAALKKENISTRISNSAGTYVCNYVFYQLMKSQLGSEVKCGFIHVPSIPEQNEKGASMPLETIVKGLETILKTLSMV
jgi:pyroglutamyl-peptidase